MSGAVCSNEITPRTFAPGVAFPSVQEYEIPALLADVSAVRNGTDTPYFTPALSDTDAVYAIWIGTNDLGNNGFLTNSQVAGKTLVDYTNCVFEAFDKLYAFGGRYFVLFNNAPLDLAPQYANASENGVAVSRYWTNKAENLTAVSIDMQEEVVSTNAIFEYELPYESRVANRYPDANFALFDVHSLVSFPFPILRPSLAFSKSILSFAYFFFATQLIEECLL